MDRYGMQHVARVLSLPLFSFPSRLRSSGSIDYWCNNDRLARRSVTTVLLATFGIVISCVGGFDASAYAQVPLETRSLQASPIAEDAISMAVAKGKTFELEQRWPEAIEHYEKASRDYPNSRNLYQRLIISRLHQDVNRRYNDQSFVGSANTMTPAQALELYSEILEQLESHYVDSVVWSRVLLHGTAALEIALTEDRFLQNVPASVDRNRIYQFHQTIHQRISSRPTNGRFDLRGTVAYVANLAREEVGLNPTMVIMEYVSGAVSTLDPYTRLLSGDQLDDMFSNIEGNFVGLGVELATGEDALKILSVIPGGPADEAGMKAGERIVRVEDSATATSDPETAADLLRGEEKSFVSLTVETPAGVARDLNVQRRRVEVPCVENVHIVDPVTRIGYLRLTNFQKTTTRDIELALWELHRQGMRGLVMDLRGNPGGLLSAAVEVADRFLSSGRIVTTRGRNARENYDYIAHQAKTWDVPLAVLIDGDSASASEIFAGAIADSSRGVLVGEQSYGKGSVQGIFRMQAAKFGLCLTTAKFFSPNGTAISLNGVAPDVSVESKYIAARPNEDGELTLDTEDDALQAAVQQLAARGQLISRRQP